jgi:hypothetical protein
MKPPKKLKRLRDTPLKKICELSKTETDRAFAIAMHGREFTELEMDVFLNRFGARHAQFVPASYIIANQKSLCEKFLLAIRQGNVTVIQDMFKALQEVKSREGFLARNKITAKEWRATALFSKLVLDASGEQWPIRKIASLVGSKEHENSHPTLRDILTEIHYPLKRGK